MNEIRLNNYIKFVAQDQIIMTNDSKNKDERYCENLRKIILEEGRINSVADWVNSHEWQLKGDVNDCCNNYLYNMVLDGLILECEEMNGEVDTGSLAFEYEKEYSRNC